MSDSIFDTLELVELTDDDSKNMNDQQICHPDTNKSFNPDETDENCHLKVSCRTKPSVGMTSSWSQKSRSSFTKQTLPSKQSINHEKNDNQFQATSASNGLRKLNDNDKFNCQSCAHYPNDTCGICHGKSRLSGNDKIIKFFEFILDFKLGKKQAYRPKQEKITSKRTIPNEHCSIYFSTINPKLSISQKPEKQVRFSLSNDNSRLMAMAEQEERLKNGKQIHYNYACDHCDIDPIQGPRYHCNTCGDFDLCERCYERNVHSHDLYKIELKSNKKALQKINNLLRGTTQNNIRSSIRNSSSICHTISNKACKSWIR